jgi:sugar fermentation stimulation protein A
LPQPGPHARARCRARVWVSERNPARCRPHLELVADGGLVGSTPSINRLVEGDRRRAHRQLRVRSDSREVRYDERCRIDLLLHQGGRPDCFVEVKNVHLKRIAGAEFPDAVTVRGAKHLGALARQVAQGARAVVLYVVQRTDCADFRIAADIDPIYAASFAAALDGGVEALCYACEVGLEDVRLSAPLPILLS